ncbi:hypothetical protein ABEW24_09295 [Paenibacillus jamilae]|uniref:hypothetical protein n=1 Tax=Paenibacillus TaxID=44249 RepID=UPI000A95E90D|nr:hypothetical protein [Paenibacillus polymyxa]
MLVTIISWGLQQQKEYKDVIMSKFICAVCGYNELNYPQWDKHGFPTHEICNCCGFESGFDDDAKDIPESIEEYRIRWLSEGANWFSSSKTKPLDWNLAIQLKRINVDISK